MARSTEANPICPRCNSPEVHPPSGKLLVRGNKVEDEGVWWSQCLVCSGFYDNMLRETPDKHVAARGWFKSQQ